MFTEIGQDMLRLLAGGDGVNSMTFTAARFGILGSFFWNDQYLLAPVAFLSDCLLEQFGNFNLTV
jgi:hypothetical protein